jgi:hypothetical protein
MPFVSSLQVLPFNTGDPSAAAPVRRFQFGDGTSVNMHDVYSLATPSHDKFLTLTFSLSLSLFNFISRHGRSYCGDSGTGEPDSSNLP